MSRRRREALAVALICGVAGLTDCRKAPNDGLDLVATVRAGAAGVGSESGCGLSFATAPRAAELEIDNERRPVAVTSLETWRWCGLVPAGGGHLHVGAQLLPEVWARAPGLELSIEAVSGSRREILEVARARPTERQRWLDLDVDLDRLAGQRVHLEFVPRALSAAPAELRQASIAWGPVRLSARARGKQEQRPNVLFVLVDTLRADHLRAYGYGRDTAPNVDQSLAARGTVVDTAYSQAPWTLPSVISFMTSREPGEMLSGKLTTYRLPPDVETMAERFARLGYRTGGFYANEALHAGIGFARGFETFYVPPAKLDSLRLHAEGVTAHATAWLRAYQNDRFFMYLHLVDPHDPYENPEIVANRSPFEETPYLGKVAGDWIHGIWLGILKLENPVADRAHITALYDSEIHYADRFLGQLLAELSPDVLSNTLIVFTADHGEELFDHGSWKHGQSVYDDQIHVPLIVRWDGHIKPGGRLGGTVRLLDLLPTLNAAAGGEADPKWEGANLLPALLGQSAVPRQAALSQTLSGGPTRMSAVLDGKKLMLFNRRGPYLPDDLQQDLLWRIDLGRMQREELYDLRADGHELRNLARSDPRAVEERGALIARQLNREAPGVRIFVSGVPEGARVSGTISFDRPPTRWNSYFLADQDRVELLGDRLHFDLEGDALEKGILVEGDFSAMRGLEAAVAGGSTPVSLLIGDGVRYSHGEIPLAQLGAPKVPEALAGPAIRVWLAAGRGASSPHSEESEETLRRLRALGYVQ